MSATTRRSLRSLIRGGAGIAVAMGVANVASYAYTILAAHLLGPRAYGGVASLMGLLLVVNVLALGLQATGARRVAADPEHRDEIEASVLAATNRSALVLGAACLALTPVISWALSLDSWAAALMIGASAIPLTMMGGQAGILQGEERWMPLAAVYLGMGLGRLGFGAVLMPIFPTAFGAMLAVALGAWVPALIGAIVLGQVSRARNAAGAVTSPGVPDGLVDRTRLRAARIVREVVSNSNALLAFFALSNLDVVLARIRFAEHEAGLYAGGLILTKAVLFLPQFVVVIAFPSMASATSQHRMYLRALVAVGIIGLTATLGAAVLSDIAVAFIGGDAYREVEPNIWLFATLGTLLALVQMMVYELVARQHRASVLILWGGLLAVAAVGSLVDSGAALVRGVALVDLAVLLILLLTARFHPAFAGPTQTSPPHEESAAP